MRIGGNTPDIWVLETRRGVASRITSSGVGHIMPVWSPDGRTILFAGGSPFNIFRIRADGSGDHERVIRSEHRQGPYDWSHDGRFIIFGDTAPETGTDLWILPVTPEGTPTPGTKPWPFAHERFNEQWGRFSPDTRWVAYQSNESGRYEAYIRPFPESGEKVRVSTGGGTFPQWGPQSNVAGCELFYVSPDSKLMMATLKLSARSVEPSVPRELFPMPPGLSELYPYDASADGQRFLINTSSDSPQPLNVIVNWPALLKKGPGAHEYLNAY
jgi:Tol biopolymer transport system component